MRAVYFLLMFLASCSAQYDLSWDNRLCPVACICEFQYSTAFQSNLRTVDCVNRGLPAVPEGIPLDAQMVLLSGNRISQLKPFSSKLHDLLALDLSSNQMESIPQDDVFESLYNLRNLNLSGNLLERLDDNVFQGLLHLEELDLSRNQISSLQENAFLGLRKLEKLDLSLNRITWIQPKWWSSIPSVYELNLSSNHINMVQQGAFKELRNIYSLNLADNKIFGINRDGFRGLSRLEYLNLAGNQLTGVPRRPMLRVKSSLKSINLGRNPIIVLDTGDFEGLTKLHEIIITKMPRLIAIEPKVFSQLPNLLVVELFDHPNLAYIHPEAFQGSLSLTHLFLHNNNLSTLEQIMISDLPRLGEVTFYGNPLFCDCNVRWLHQYLLLDREPIRFKEADRLVCDNPPQYRFRLFSKLPLSALPETCAPRLISTGESENSLKTNDDLRLRCNALGLPTPIIKWTFPYNRTSSHGSTSARVSLYPASTFSINNVQPKDAGRYICAAVNSRGSSTREFTISIQSAVVNIVPLQINATTAVIAWNLTRRSHLVYQLLYRLDLPSSRLRYLGGVNHLTDQYLFNGLLPNTPYQVCLASPPRKDKRAQLSCVSFTTLHAAESAPARQTPSYDPLMAFVCAMVTSGFMIAGLGVLLWKRSRRPQQMMLYFDTSFSSSQPLMASLTPVESDVSVVQSLMQYHSLKNGRSPGKGLQQGLLQI